MTKATTAAHESVVAPTTAATVALRPVAPSGVTSLGGFWEDRVRVNRERSLPHGAKQLADAGTLANFRLAAGTADGPYRALGVMFNDLPYPFLDSDVYKWLEAVGWELGRAADPALAQVADEAIGLVAAAQRPDGYLNTFVQVIAGGEPYRDLQWGHELYCVGHLVQAAVAWHRALGDDRLLAIALRAVEHAERALGPEGRDAIEGHPEIEMALVELFRATGDRRHLDEAVRLIERRGHGLLGEGRFGPAYWQDHEPVRDAATVAGHAVRQLYLDCGAVDVAVETGDAELLLAVRRRWDEMVATRMYLTGGLGSRHEGEAFGDAFELPRTVPTPETCAAIAGVMLGWRLLLATGDEGYADVIERLMFNAVLPAISLDGTSFFYVNPLQLTSERAVRVPEETGRQHWFPCACCPPNVMRMLASWPQYLATAGDDSVELHQYATAELALDVAGGPVRLAVETDYPWSGAVTVTVRDTPSAVWTLSLRVPGWCEAASLEVAGERRDVPPGSAAVHETRSWRAGDQVVLRLAMPVRATGQGPRIESVRGSVAFERGPLVYCVEAADVPAPQPGVAVDELELATGSEPETVSRPDLPAARIGLRIDAEHGEAAVVAGAIPYFAWANRDVDAMRVWTRAVRGRRARQPSEPRGAEGAGRRRERRPRAGWARDPLVRQRQRCRSGRGRAGHQAERRPVRRARSRIDGRRLARRRSRGRRRPPSLHGHADASDPLPGVPGGRRGRPHALPERHRVGPGRARDPLPRDDACGLLPGLGPGHAAPRAGGDRRRLRVGDRQGDRRVAARRGPDRNGCAGGARRVAWSVLLG